MQSCKLRFFFFFNQRTFDFAAQGESIITQYTLILPLCDVGVEAECMQRNSFACQHLALTRKCVVFIVSPVNQFNCITNHRQRVPLGFLEMLSV